jgi:pimeloyl-ACP methyl ester carboxylesterase
MANIVLVPGGFHGAWYFTPILSGLRANGHTVHAITLSGLGGHANKPWPPINLDTHIADVIDLIETERLEDVILCGHSYAGLVISGVADRMPGRIRTLVFLDAIVPHDGDSVWSLWNADQRDGFVAHSLDGIVTNPPPGVDDRARAHPLACFLQPVRLDHADYGVDDRVFVWCSAWQDGPYRAINQRVTDAGGWDMRELPSGHDFMKDAPEAAGTLIAAVAESRDNGRNIPS